MGYHLRAVIAPEPLARQVAAAFGAGSRAVPLTQDFALVPYTDQAHEQLLTTTASGAGTFVPFWWLCTSAAHLLIDLSRFGALAYVEAEYFGGIGTQHAIVWHHRSTAHGPFSTPDNTPTAPTHTPISQALSHLGITGATAHRDEFDILGLGRHRHLEDWLNNNPPAEG
jgi:hypothetical protein